MQSTFESLIASFCKNNSIEQLPKQDDVYDFYIGNVHTKLLDLGDRAVFLSELAVGIDDEEESDKLLIRFINRNTEFLLDMPDTIALNQQGNVLYLQRLVDLGSTDIYDFEEQIFSHIDNANLFSDIY